MSNLGWKYRRLQAMGIAEVSYRIRQLLNSMLEKKGYGLSDVVPEPKGNSGRPHTDIHAVASMIACEPYLSAANKILAGRYSVFALQNQRLGFPPEWNRDPKTKTLAPLTFGKSLNYRDEALVGDIKYLWEVNRQLELVTLGQAYACSSDTKYFEGIKVLIDSWIEQCPYPLGANWISSLEQAVRLCNWAITWQLIGGDSSALFQGMEGARFRTRWLNTIYQHMYFIRGYLSKYSSANNHLLGEYMGLFIGTVTWPLWAQCESWRDFAASGFTAEALLQNAPDGVNREQAIWYHHEVADMMLLCGLTGRANGYEFTASYWDRLEKMLEFIASLMDVKGNIPMIGDSDDAIMVRFYPNEFNVFRSLLATGAVIFRRYDFKFKAQEFDDKSRWLLGVDGEAKFHTLIAPDENSILGGSKFEDGGYWVLGSELDSLNEVRITADGGTLGYLSIAAHGHSDALAFTLSVAGNEILIDPGTYSYHTQKKWRDYFRGTSAHNTVRIDYMDQSESGGNFLWLKHAQAKCLNYLNSEYTALWEAEHYGYHRLSDPVTHRRLLKLDKEKGQLTVIDTFDCRGSHQVEIFWHLAECCKVEVADSGVVITTGTLLVRLHMPDGVLALELVRGCQNPPLGWVSRSFDSKIPTSTLKWHGEITGCTSLKTVILISQEILAER